MKNLIHEINGIKYVLIEYMATRNTDTKLFEDYCNSAGIILQSSRIETIGGWLFGQNVAQLSLLVPETQLIAFNLQKFSK